MDNSYRENEGLPFTKQQLAAVLLLISPDICQNPIR